MHAALLIALLRAPPATSISPDLGVMNVSLFIGQAPTPSPKPASHAITAPPPAATPLQPKPPPQPTEVTPQFVDVSLTRPEVAERDPLQDPVALSVAAAASGASGQTCQIGAWLQAAMQTDPQVQAALLDIPRPARSVSNALMLWDGGWTEATPKAAAGIAAIRAAVLAGLASAPEACRTQMVRGPELMTLVTGAETTVIAIGSGEWRWGDLMPAAPPTSLFKTALSIR